MIHWVISEINGTSDSSYFITPDKNSVKEIFHSLLILYQTPKVGTIKNKRNGVGFVMEKISGSMSEKVQPIEFTKLRRKDTDESIHDPILPTYLKILKGLGVNEERLLKT